MVDGKVRKPRENVCAQAERLKTGNGIFCAKYAIFLRLFVCLYVYRLN